jgi:hypothetical protein
MPAPSGNNAKYPTASIIETVIATLKPNRKNATIMGISQKWKY